MGYVKIVHMALTSSLKRSPPRAAPREWFVPDDYLTDGRRLFRVVSQLADGARQGFCSLEDCSTLEVDTYLPGELATMGLRPVQLAGARGTHPPPPGSAALTRAACSPSP